MSKFNKSSRIASEFPPITSMLSLKRFKRFNILVGDDKDQQRFAESLLGHETTFKDKLLDIDLLSEGGPKLFRVHSSSLINLSPQVLQSTSLWSMDPMEKGSAGAFALVRHASKMVNVDADKQQIQRAADALQYPITNILSALWFAAWCLLGASKPEPLRWAQPWDDAVLWFDIPDVSPEYRLNTLYSDLTAFVLSFDGNPDTLRKAGVRVSTSKAKYFKSLKLNLAKVHGTIEVLDNWKTFKTDSFICAFQVFNIWKK